MTLKASDFPSFNQAVAAAVARGKDLFVDPGDHDATSTVRVPDMSSLKIWGAGNVSRVIPRFSQGDVLHIGQEDRETQNLLLEDFALVPPAEGRIGWGMRLDKCVRSSINNVDVGNPETARHDNGIWLNGYDDCRIDDCNVYARWRGILVNGQRDQSGGADLVIGGGVKVQNHRSPDMSDLQQGAVGLHLAGGQGGTYVDAAHFIYCGVGILMDQGVAGVMNREIFLNPGCVVDSCAEDGIRVLAGAVGTLQLTGVWSASHGRAGDGCGLRVQPDQHPIATIQVTGGRYFNNRSDGIALNGGTSFVSGPVLNGNGGYGLHVANGAARGAADPLFAALAPNRRGPLRNVSTQFRVGAVY